MKVSKRRLASQLMNYPFLRILIYDVRFRWVVIIFALLPLTGWLAARKTWRVSPPGWTPVQEISLLDSIQAWHARSKAKNAAGLGKHDLAIVHLQNALGNRPLAVDLLRELLAAVTKSSNPLEYKILAAESSALLLRLSGTNVNDLDLAAEAAQITGNSKGMVDLLYANQAKLSGPLRVRLLKTMFDRAEMQAFATLSASGGSNKTDDPELKLYQTAYEAGWGQAGQRTEHLEVLRGAMNSSPSEKTATRLLLKVAAQLGDAELARVALARLQTLRADGFDDHLACWETLQRAGHRDEAVQRQQAYSSPLLSGEAKLKLARFRLSLGLKSDALEFLRISSASHPEDTGLWRAYADLLFQEKLFDDLRGVSLQIRARDPLRFSLEAYTWFLEGKAELELGHAQVAEAHFAKAAAAELQEFDLVEPMVQEMRKLGLLSLSEKLLARFSKGPARPGL